MSISDTVDVGHIVIYPSRAKLALLTLLALAFVVACAWISMRPGCWTRYPLKTPFVCYVGTPFFTLCAMYGLWRLLCRKPALIIYAEGIFDNASGIGAGLVRWSEIRAIEPVQFKGQRSLGIWPHDDEAILERLPAWKRGLKRMNKGLGLPVVTIPEAVLPMKLDELLAVIGRFSSFGTQPRNKAETKPPRCSIVHYLSRHYELNLHVLRCGFSWYPKIVLS